MIHILKQRRPDIGIKRKGYAAFKEKNAPLMHSDLINAPVSSKGTPNLIITGEFHDSITATPTDKGLK